MGNTYGQVNTLTNVIYACDREDGEVFEADSLERAFFERFMRKRMRWRPITSTAGILLPSGHSIWRLLTTR